MKKLWRKNIIEDKKCIQFITFLKEKSIKSITTGSLHIALKSGLLHTIPKGTTAGMLGHIAWCFYEIGKLWYKIIKKEISPKNGLDLILECSISLLIGLLTISSGTFQGLVIGTMIGIQFPYLGRWSIGLGSLIGGAVGYMFGAKIGSFLYHHLKKMTKSIKKLLAKQ